MKRLLLSCLALLAFGRSGNATDFRQATLETLADSDAVYLVRVISLKDARGDVFSDRVGFSITEVLKGKRRPSLTLTPLFLSDFKKGAEYILYYTDSDFKDTVGWNGVEDVCQWLQLRISHHGGKIMVEKIGPLDQLKNYLRQHS